ncbi:hypothetical protein QN277_013113 [Acacia crassicarpa]|uniref:Uncharacterized protein n=1 Tax=Acacia crassicarpa TaxID=499986 RepID=A0AAE1TEE7_9FABA|nr:hypothetical protein QN277_013113 [Acacia crassicarpa]
MTVSVEDSAVYTKAIQEIVMEEDEDLFEIDLEAVNAIPPPHYWESYYTSTGNALLANCLLPISDISVAVPAGSSVCMAATTEVLGDVAEPVSLGEYLGLPFLGALELLNQ